MGSFLVAHTADTQNILQALCSYALALRACNVAQ